MLHLRTTLDSVPIDGTASRRALVAIRTAQDAAPAQGGAASLVIPEIAMILFGLFCDIEWLLMSVEDNIGARAPPCREVVSRLSTWVTSVGG